MPRIVLTSYIPPEPHLWPASGNVEWSQITEAIRKVRDIELEAIEQERKFLSIPCQHPGRLHWQGNWVVLEIDDADYQEVNGFVIFKRGRVLFNGPAKHALVYLRQSNIPAPYSLEPVKVALDFEDITLGDDSIAIAGWDSKATVGVRSLAFAENDEAIAGEYGIAISTYGSVAARDLGCAWTQHGDKAKAGHRGVARTYEGGCSEVAGVGVATTDDWGTATCGQRGVALAGAFGTAIAGERGVAYARQDGKVMAAERGVLLLVHHDEIKIAKVGENGIKANTPYQLDYEGNFIECELAADEQSVSDATMMACEVTNIKVEFFPNGIQQG